MSEVDKAAFWESANEGFLTPNPAQDMLHPEAASSLPGPTLTETQYFGFSSPEDKVQGFGYMWLHPNLKTVSGGTYAWTGIKEHNFECELFDFGTYMHSDDVFHDDLWDYRLENGYHVQTIEPLKRHRIRYDDPSRKNKYDIQLDAVMPPVVLASGLHLEQAVKATGTLTLRGKEYEISGCNVRDRSWGALRSERHLNSPPLAWMTGISEENLNFGCTAFDTPGISLDNYPGLEIPGGESLKVGWVYTDGQLVSVVAARKKTTRNPRTLVPETITLELTDTKGCVYDIRGSIVTAANWRAWHNLEVFVCVARWEYAGKVFYGDVQEMQWIDFVRAARQHRQ